MSDDESASSHSLPEIVSAVVDRETNELLSLLKQRDDLVPVMLRFHLATENLLERIIIAKLPGGHGFLEKSGATYHQKLELVNAMQIVSSGAIGALRALNKLRNASAHTAGTAIGNREIEAIGRPLGKAFAQIRQEHAGNNIAFVHMTFAQIFAALLAGVLLSEQPDLVKSAKEANGGGSSAA